MDKKFIPQFTTELKKHMIKVPEIIKEKSSGINILGKTIHSVLFSTDIAIIKNSNADAVIAVYPFTPHPAISQAIMSVADVPVFCGIGGGITNGIRSVNVALHAEFQGAMAVVLNAPTPNETITAVKNNIDIPIILTVVSEFTNVKEKLEAGADIINVSGAANTPKIVENIRKSHPYLPIIATGGNTTQSIEETINAGANAITFTPPTNGELFKMKMEYYRESEANKFS